LIVGKSAAAVTAMADQIVIPVRGEVAFEGVPRLSWPTLR
jgi:hypothetical protein